MIQHDYTENIKIDGKSIPHQVRTIITKIGITLVRKNPVKRISDHMLVGDGRTYFVNGEEVLEWKIEKGVLSIIYNDL